MGSPSQRVIGRSGRHEHIECGVLFVYKNVSAAKSLNKHTNAFKSFSPRLVWCMQGGRETRCG